LRAEELRSLSKNIAVVLMSLHPGDTRAFARVTA
jgi:hypothetical protein